MQVKYSQLVDDEDLYASFVNSENWNQCLNKIREVNPTIADAINKYGIGTKIADDGQYDHESGQLLDDLPRDMKERLREGDNSEAYDLICDLANAYADYVVGHA